MISLTAKQAKSKKKRWSKSKNQLYLPHIQKTVRDPPGLKIFYTNVLKNFIKLLKNFL